MKSGHGARTTPRTMLLTRRVSKTQIVAQNTQLSPRVCIALPQRQPQNGGRQGESHVTISAFSKQAGYRRKSPPTQIFAPATFVKIFKFLRRLLSSKFSEKQVSSVTFSHKLHRLISSDELQTNFCQLSGSENCFFLSLLCRFLVHESAFASTSGPRPARAAETLRGEGLVRGSSCIRGAVSLELGGTCFVNSLLTKIYQAATFPTSPGTSNIPATNNQYKSRQKISRHVQKRVHIFHTQRQIFKNKSPSARFHSCFIHQKFLSIVK